MKEFYHIQADESGQGMELQSTMIHSRARRHTPGLPPDLIQWIVKEEPDASKQDIGQISEVQPQAILRKREGAPRTMRPGTNEGYYIYIEDEGVYVETVDEKGVPTLVLDTETDKRLTMDLITQQDTDKYFTQPGKQEDGNDTETINSTSTADYDREEVETSLANIAIAFHTIGSEYEHLCAIVPHMTKVQAANVISQLPIIPFSGKSEMVKAEMKPESATMEPMTTTTTVAPQQDILEMPRVSELERVTATEPRVTPPVSVDVDAGEVDLERDAEMSKKTSEPTEEQGPEAEKTDPYKHYILSGKGDMPEQKVNEAVKDLNYHNMLVMIAVGDKTINNVGSIHTVAEKWGLSYSIVQWAISGVKEHQQGGRQYDKITSQPQKRSRCREDKSWPGDKSEAPPPKKSKTGRGKSSKKITEKKTQAKSPEEDDSDDDSDDDSTSTADYDREEVETSLANIAIAFHTIGSEYEHLCAIVPHMTKVQAANVISQLPIIPFLGKSEKVKAEMKPESATMEPMTTTTTVAPQQDILEMPCVSELERVTATEPRVTPPVSVDVDAGEVDLERDAETSKKTSEPTEEQGPEAEKTDPYKHYILSGKGDMPDQKVNEAVKDLNYHNMLVMIAVGDKTINNVGSIHTVAEKWGLSYSIVQWAISGVKEHQQGGRQYDKITSQPQKRSRCREDKSWPGDKSEAPPPKKSKTGRGKSSKKITEKKTQAKSPEEDDSDDDEFPDVPF